MKVVIDMNLSPRWEHALAEARRDRPRFPLNCTLCSVAELMHDKAVRTVRPFAMHNRLVPLTQGVLK